MKVCKQSLIKLASTNEVEPICDYDPNNESDYWDDYLKYSIWDQLIDEDGDFDGWYGEHDILDPSYCISIADGFQDGV